MDIPHFVYPFIHWWAVGLFPPFGYYKELCYKQKLIDKFLCGHMFSFLLYNFGILKNPGFSYTHIIKNASYVFQTNLEKESWIWNLISLRVVTSWLFSSGVHSAEWEAFSVPLVINLFKLIILAILPPRLTRNPRPPLMYFQSLQICLFWTFLKYAIIQQVCVYVCVCVCARVCVCVWLLSLT